MKRTALDWWIRFFTSLLLVLLLCTGALLLLRDAWKQRLQAQAAMAVVAQIENGSSVIAIDALPPEVEVEVEDIEALIGFAKMTGQPLPEQPEESASGTDMLTGKGTLEIEKIGLKLPVLEGTGRKPLRYGAGWLTTSASPGQPGNCVLLGHRMRQKGRMFNRLDELRAGDIVTLTDADGNSYAYAVFETATVEPGQLFEELYRNTDGRFLSLVTCTPVGVGSHRMVVWCRIQEADV